jgi:ATP-dependent helicase/nuclease subunit B
MGALAHALADNGLEVVGTERQVTFTVPDGPEVRGYVDLLTLDPAGAPVILDLKWTRGAYHRDDLAEGRAVQLATYVAAVTAGSGPGDGGPSEGARAGYFRLMQHEFATLRADRLAGARIDGPPLAETWEATLDAWRTWTRGAADGQLIAAGVAGAEEAWPPGLAPLREPRCAWCDFAGLCRIGEAP